MGTWSSLAGRRQGNGRQMEDSLGRAERIDWRPFCWGSWVGGGAEVKGTDGRDLAFLRNPVMIFILNVIIWVLMFL